MKQYIIESPHTKEECLSAMDDTLKIGADAMKQFKWGCMAGNHTAWAIVDADDPDEAKKMVPASLRYKAKASEIDEITPEQVKSFHKM